MLDDDSLMPFGEHAGKAMRDVPARYLDWLLGQEWLRDSSRWAPVLAYIEANIKAVQAEIED